MIIYETYFLITFDNYLTLFDLKEAEQDKKLVDNLDVGDKVVALCTVYNS